MDASRYREMAQNRINSGGLKTGGRDYTGGCDYQGGDARDVHGKYIPGSYTRCKTGQNSKACKAAKSNPWLQFLKVAEYENPNMTRAQLLAEFRQGSPYKPATATKPAKAAVPPGRQAGVYRQWKADNQIVTLSDVATQGNPHFGQVPAYQDWYVSGANYAGEPEMQAIKAKKAKKVKRAKKGQLVPVPGTPYFQLVK